MSENRESDNQEPDNREFEIVVWGASGFTGKLTAEYLARRSREIGGIRWALGGRNQAKLESVRKEIADETGIEPPVLVGDSADDAFMAELSQRTRVVCSTVGPYALYGSKLVAACAENGAHYCDLTGESHWMQQMIDRHQNAAVASGARIVFTCGFDCIPSDLGAFFMQREMNRRHGVRCSAIQFRVQGFSGAASGGTIASMLNMMEEAETDPGVMHAMNDPYALNPKGERQGPDGPQPVAPSHDADFGQWVAPFVMGGIDTQVVRRTNALLDYSYGRDFRYDEAVLMGSGPVGFAKAAATSAGTLAMLRAMSVGPIRRRAERMLPSPGEGPSKQKREAGYFDIRIRGEHPTEPAKALRGRITGDRDPGYGSTSKMLSESALCLARDPLNVGGGFWTPASAMGEPLLARLTEHAGVTFTIDDHS
jgi:short subunit dehydrogenase-like uncharacterized protein